MTLVRNRSYGLKVKGSREVRVTRNRTTRNETGSFGLFLVVLAVVLTWFGGPGSGPATRPRFARGLRLAIAREPVAPDTVPRSGRYAVLLVALVAAATTVPSHTSSRRSRTSQRCTTDRTPTR